MLQGDPNHTTHELGREEAEERQAKVNQVDLQQQRRVAHQLDVGLDRQPDQPVLGHARPKQKHAQHQGQRHRGEPYPEGDCEALKQLGEKPR